MKRDPAERLLELIAIATQRLVADPSPAALAAHLEDARSSLDLLAFAVRFTERRIVAVVDARRGELFHATYRQVPGGVQRLGEPALSSPDDLANDLFAVDDETLLVGDGVQRYHDAFSDLRRVEIAEQGQTYPSAGSLVLLAHAQAMREQFVNSWELAPLYLRKPDAEINWQTRDGGS